MTMCSFDVTPGGREKTGSLMFFAKVLASDRNDAALCQNGKKNSVLPLQAKFMRCPSLDPLCHASCRNFCVPQNLGGPNLPSAPLGIVQSKYAALQAGNVPADLVLSCAPYIASAFIYAKTAQGLLPLCLRARCQPSTSNTKWVNSRARTVQGRGLPFRRRSVLFVRSASRRIPWSRNGERHPNALWVVTGWGMGNLRISRWPLPPETVCLSVCLSVCTGICFIFIQGTFL
jgi:hypothetical protein